MKRSLTLNFTGENAFRPVNVQGAYAVAVVALNPTGDVQCEIAAVYTGMDASIASHVMQPSVVVSGNSSRAWGFSTAAVGMGAFFVPDVLELRLTTGAKASFRWIVHLYYDD